ncbi:MAG: DNA-binding transcriptional regulator Fis [Gammaproteobacteria bacterium]|nr:DNA-binding transcriptional regulator Fis [Gammaproteobacteria bacterium]
MNDSRHSSSAHKVSATVTPLARPQETADEPLRLCVERALEAYFARLDGETAKDLYGMVLAEMEAPLLETVMRHADGNQCQAAAMLGINRGTLRKKLKQYDLLK